MAVTTLAAPSVPNVARGRQPHRRDDKAGWGMTAPFLVLYLAFLVGPLVYGIIMSFTNASMVKSGLNGWAGLSNYAEVLSNGDFWSSMWHTVLFTIVTTPPLVIISLAMAMLTDRLRRGRWFFRLVFFVPYAVPSAAVALVFGWM